MSLFYPLLLWTCALVSNAEVGQMKEACRVSAAVDHSPASLSWLLLCLLVLALALSEIAHNL